VMCYGAIKNARIKEVVIGCLEPKHGFSNFVSNTQKMNVKQTILEEECSLLMRTFFERKRG